MRALTLASGIAGRAPHSAQFPDRSSSWREANPLQLNGTRLQDNIHSTTDTPSLAMWQLLADLAYISTSQDAGGVLPLLPGLQSFQLQASH